ncbi:hypothetical protein CBOM_02574 [Ceraceosorus bombacis]|uniref:Uncharacterized protein n=1 Tax=Ceraceosorus bombacis TaxID=401625 RepID=A0A0P1BG94_9BASI|nr:hypothetical protein CBOM_02574 [Ceraceosorus bombacis]
MPSAEEVAERARNLRAWHLTLQSSMTMKFACRYHRHRLARPSTPPNAKYYATDQTQVQMTTVQLLANSKHSGASACSSIVVVQRDRMSRFVERVAPPTFLSDHVA